MAAHWPRLPPQALPRPIIAFRNETVQSFTTRLARANAVSLRELRTYAAGTDRYVDPDRLARLSGYPPEALRDRLRGFDEEDRDFLRQRARSRPACRWCSAKRGVFEPVYCWLPDDVTVCQRHSRWIGPSARQWSDQLSLKHHPDAVRAAAVHLNLVQHHPADIVEIGMNEASRITLRHRRFQKGRNCTGHAKPRARWARITDAQAHVETYRETVHLARIIVDYRPVLLNLTNFLDSRITDFTIAANNVFSAESTDAGQVVANWLNEQRTTRSRRLATCRV